MEPSVRPHSSRYVHTHPMGREVAVASFSEDVASGLSAASKRLSCRFLYDAQGSKLFEAICAQPEYYPFDAEADIMLRHGADIASALPTPCELVELGSGSAEKTQRLIAAVVARQGETHFSAIDISDDALRRSGALLTERFPLLSMTGIAAAYEPGLDALPSRRARSRVFLWLGSSIGNLKRDAAKAFVRGLASHMDASHGDRLLLGVDLRKSREMLEAAYDDSAGVTADFSLNLLARINRELGGDFDLAHFAHEAVWLEEEGRVAIHLRSLRAQEVHVRDLGLRVAFGEDERIHIEDSFKYSAEEIQSLASAAGLVVERTFADSQRRFVEVLLRPDDLGSA